MFQHAKRPGLRHRELIERGAERPPRCSFIGLNRTVCVYHSSLLAEGRVESLTHQRGDECDII